MIPGAVVHRVGAGRGRGRGAALFILRGEGPSLPGPQGFVPLSFQL